MDDDDLPETTCPDCGFYICACDDTPDDCMNCGVCDSCIDRSIAAADDTGEFDIGGSD